MRLGQEPGVFHTLGMARSLGFGRCRIVVDTPSKLTRNDGTEISLKECEQAFEAYMETWAAEQRIPGGWRGSQQIFQLLASAKPFEKETDGRSMMLDHPDLRNEFNEAKKSKLVLAPAGSPEDWARAYPNQQARVPLPARGAQLALPSRRDPPGNPGRPSASPSIPSSVQGRGTPPQKAESALLVPEEPSPGELPLQFTARFHSFSGARDAKNTLRDRRRRGKPAKEALLQVIPEKSNLRGLAEKLYVSTTRTEGFEAYFDRISEKFMGMERSFRIISWSKQEDDSLLVTRMEAES
jgi:hypothetical protein